MDQNRTARMAAIAVGATVLFGLEQGLEMALYFAIPIAILAYVATLLAMGLMLKPGADKK